MVLADVLERSCEKYIAKAFEVYIESVSAADGNEDLIALAEEKFKKGIATSINGLVRAKKILES